MVLCELPWLTWLRGQSVGTAFSVFVFDLIENIDAFFAEVGRVVSPDGSLVVIINHPAFTAPGSGPFMDSDHDVFWRWGDYFGRGSSLVPAGSGAVGAVRESRARARAARTRP
mgnify:FL=1